jgi:hypothetical protein
MRERERAAGMRVIIHTGTPKTGTTALQNYLTAYTAALAGARIWIPPVLEPTGRHQQLVAAMRRAEHGDVADVLTALLAPRPPWAETAFVSAEGLYAHWFDAPDAGRAAFARAVAQFDAEIWVCFRDPRSFAESYYAQCLRNAPHDPLHARDISLDAMLDLPAFRALLDYTAYLDAVDGIAGADRVRVFRYDRDAVGRIISALGVPFAADTDGPTVHTAVNPSLCEAGVALQRIVNRQSLALAAWERARDHVAAINAELTVGSPPFRADAATAARIEREFGAGWLRLRSRLDTPPR